MFKLGKMRPLPGHSSIGSISTRKKLHPGVPPPTTESNKGGSVPAIWQNQARRLLGVHPEYSDTASGSVSSETPKRGTTSRFTGAGSLLPPVYSEVWAKGIPRTPFSSLRDAAHGRHAGRKTNVVSQKQIKQQKSNDLKKYTIKEKLN
ncbi:hypothetical protein TNCV_2451751 [Trichonephila clavipes]|nr:hypothetical protein TNCV_2451751 [Trichonephila clavipes]